MNSPKGRMRTRSVIVHLLLKVLLGVRLLKDQPYVLLIPVPPHTLTPLSLTQQGSETATGRAGKVRMSESAASAFLPYHTKTLCFQGGLQLAS